MTRSKSRRSSCINRRDEPEIPALFTITCSAPKCCWAWSIAACTLSASETSVWTNDVAVAERVHHLGRGLVVEVGDDDSSTLLDEHLGDRPSDPVRATGDDRDLAFELVAHVRPPCPSSE